jgi:hypothetical protein
MKRREFNHTGQCWAALSLAAFRPAFAQLANHTTVPVAYANMLYSLRDHIELVRERLEKHASATRRM